MIKSDSRTIVVRRTAAIGDVVAATVVADRLIELGHDVKMQCAPMIHGILKRHPRISGVEGLIKEPDVNLDRAYEDNPNRNRVHFYSMFMSRANQQLYGSGIELGPALNCKPTLRVGLVERQAAMSKLKAYPRPWVFICPRSNFYASRQVPDGIWQSAASKMQGTKFWLGTHPSPPGLVDLKCQFIDHVFVWLSAADLLVTVDTGPMHLAAAMGIPIVALGQASSPELHLSDQCDFITLEPKLDCLNCQKNICPINTMLPPCQSFDPDLIAAWVNAKLRQSFGNHVSAIVPIYQPDATTLNRCLECILPQVQEIIVTSEANSVVPAGALQHQKIRYVRKGMARIGYGRNVNFGARHSTGKWLLLLNDDVFLKPDAVSKMVQAAKPNTGMVCHLLRYPDGTIYPVAMGRNVGANDWYHMDYKKTESSLRQPTELEVCCGASVLVRREAFYQIGGFDERFFIYCEDNDFSLRIRKAGWKVLFLPHVEGTHINGESTKKLSISQRDMIASAGKLFHQKWDPYLRHNLNRVPGTFDYA